MAAREVEGTGARVLDTRKTTPGLRALEKAAVAAGGGVNHRAGLYDAILIKENHIAAAGGIAAAVERARASAPALAGTLEVEVRDAREIDEALPAGAPRLLLDNMDLARTARGGRTGRRARRAGGQRRRRPLHAPGRGGDGGRMGLDGRADTLARPPWTSPSRWRRCHEPPDGSCSGHPRRRSQPRRSPRLKDEVRALAAERDAVILAHNYQLPEVQEVADYVGDSLGLSRQAAAAEGETIVFCGVHFMAETASILCPEKTVLIPDLDAGCSLAASIDAEQLAAWRARVSRRESS